MPGMDGWAVIKALKADPELSSIPVIMITMADDRSLGYALGAADYITKPIDRERLASSVARYRLADAPGSVLIVEDDPATREIMARTLANDGWKVTEAENGKVALERLAEAVPDLILLDLMMPEMDGFEFVSAIREKEAWRSIPVVVVTAKDITPQDQMRLEGNVRKIFHKATYTREELVGEIRSAMEPPSPRAAAAARGHAPSAPRPSSPRPCSPLVRRPVRGAGRAAAAAPAHGEGRRTARSTTSWTRARTRRSTTPGAGCSGSSTTATATAGPTTSRATTGGSRRIRWTWTATSTAAPTAGSATTTRGGS